MRAVQFESFGGPEVLAVSEVAEPHASAGQIRVAVKAVGINPVDWKFRQGMMGGDLPRGTGLEVAGVVDEVGDGVSDVSAGDEVFGSVEGGNGAADFALLEHYARIPPSLAFAAAAGLTVAVETAARTLDLVDVGEGQTVLINGAAGAVGISTVQLARERGARVIGTASAANHDYLRSFGAEPTTYGDGLVERVRALAPDGVDRAIDDAGGGVLCIAARSVTVSGSASITANGGANSSDGGGGGGGVVVVLSTDPQPAALTVSAAGGGGAPHTGHAGFTNWLD